MGSNETICILEDKPPSIAIIGDHVLAPYNQGSPSKYPGIISYLNPKKNGEGQHVTIEFLDGDEAKNVDVISLVFEKDFRGGIVGVDWVPDSKNAVLSSARGKINVPSTRGKINGIPVKKNGKVASADNKENFTLGLSDSEEDAPLIEFKRRIPRKKNKVSLPTSIPRKKKSKVAAAADSGSKTTTFPLTEAEVVMCPISFEALESSTNHAYNRKMKRAGPTGSEWEKYIESTQWAGFEWRTQSKSNLNLLIVGFVNGTGSWGGLTNNGRPYEPNSLRNKRNELQDYLNTKWGEHNGGELLGINVDPEFTQGPHTAIACFTQQTVKARHDPVLREEGFGTKKNAAGSIELKDEKEIDDSSDLNDPLQRRQLTVKAFSVGFALRGGEAKDVQAASLTRGVDGEGVRYVEYDPAHVKNHAQNMASATGKEPPPKRRVYESAPGDPKSYFSLISSWLDDLPLNYLDVIFVYSFIEKGGQKSATEMRSAGGGVTKFNVNRPVGRNGIGKYWKEMGERAGLDKEVVSRLKGHTGRKIACNRLANNCGHLMTESQLREHSGHTSAGGFALYHTSSERTKRVQSAAIQGGLEAAESANSSRMPALLPHASAAQQLPPFFPMPSPYYPMASYMPSPAAYSMHPFQHQGQYMVPPGFIPAPQFTSPSEATSTTETTGPSDGPRTKSG